MHHLTTMKYSIKTVALLALMAHAAACPISAEHHCYSMLKNDTLIIGNQVVERKFLWNDGQLITHSIVDKKGNHTLFNKGNACDFMINAKEKAFPSNAQYQMMWVESNSIHESYLKTIITYAVADVQIRREYRIYEDCPVIACDTYLKGSLHDVSAAQELNDVANRKNIEFAADMESQQKNAVLDQLHVEGQHWQAKAVEFLDVTDWNNNLVVERRFIPYRKRGYRGNLLFAKNMETDGGFFFLKEAPCSDVQLAYPGADFISDFGKFQVTGLGITSKDITPDNWVKAYSCALGIFRGNELEALKALRSYQKKQRMLLLERDEMVMMNTWGDRSQDTKVNEAFCLRELELAHRLGITYFQIDDGWQVGKSPNSAVAKGSFKDIWSNPDYWTPDPVKYPRGLAPIVEKGKQLGIEIGIWFNPSIQNDFADWEKDANALIKLYHDYGIRTFKIDGLNIASKRAEVNLRKMFDKVLQVTNNQAIFNLDVTAGKRGGYFYFNEYGNIFLENRYTDWQNYYPYWTLRNLWMLSKYVPAEKLQIEFLNKWRNTEKYEEDLFAPANYSFEYLFASTMAAQPLAWLEASNLPEDAYDIQPVVKRYKEVSHDFHQGTILPVGEEPSGRSWTGFQSITSEGEGYLLIFREKTLDEKEELCTWLPEGERVKLVPVLGVGKAMEVMAGRDGRIEVTLPQSNSYVLYKYTY